MTTTEVFLIAIVLIYAVPFLLWCLLRTDYWAPLVVVQILVGILLGPGILGAAFPDYYAFVFNHDVVGALNGIAWWGVMLFVFVAGIELDISKAWEHRSETGVTAGFALVTPLAFGCIAALVILNLGGAWVGEHGATWQFILGIGMACAVTALPILILLMEKLEILRRPLGQRILRYGSLDDIAIWSVLAFVLLDWSRVGRQVAFLALFVVAAIGVRAVMRRISQTDRWYAALVWLGMAGFAADWAGLHYMVGAFLAGAVLDADMMDRKRMDQFRHVVLLAILPVYFLSAGLRTNWQAGGWLVLGAAGILLLASVSGKLIGVHIAGRILKWEKGEASVIGWLLQTKALVTIIFVNVLLDRGIINNEAFTACLLMALGSTMLAVPMVAPKLAGMRDLVFKQAEADPPVPERAPGSAQAGEPVR
jgi:Kef-type K+ transport system membrane component KefB